MPGSGRAIALAFARHGCSMIVLGDESLDALEACQHAVAGSHPSTEVHVYTLDRSSEGSVDKFFQKVTEISTRVDYAVNVISQAQKGNVPLGHDIEGYDRHFDIFQRGVCLPGTALHAQIPFDTS
jgi:NAD(P)-dependent dehydrogenase (short-subunit alcohol dehydrogenase family)